tara:strand:+ start:3094 stop:4719 length:1626 start_codon:yes stop_codon:yes gene_type:complete
VKIIGVWSGHDCSYSVLEDGLITRHDELERFNREKESPGDSFKLMKENYGDFKDAQHFATCFPTSKITQYKDSYDEMINIVKENGGNIYCVGHHKSHAANAFFSSNLSESLILTMDGGGVEDDNFETAATLWKGIDTKIQQIHKFRLNEFNIGGLWTRVTRYVFDLQNGWPRGCQAGSVMAMAALGDHEKYLGDFRKMLTVDQVIASHKPANQPKGANVGTDPDHPYLHKYRLIAKSSEEEKFNLAASLQYVTEELIRGLLTQVLEQFPSENLCLSGGVTLNCVAVGKIKNWFPQLRNVYVTPTPHDGGLPIGASQYVWHHVLDNPRVVWKDNSTPYLGLTYSKSIIQSAIDKNKDKVTVENNIAVEEVIELLNDQKIVSVFGGGSESGRRALGNRSILADPRSDKMKDLINEKVKHRQWYRPFAPSILRERVSTWFERDDDSPYMNIVLNFKEDMKEKVPAVVHMNGSARIQTVTENDNFWYYNFLKKWEEKSSVPILLNTSFNDREPICETPEHAINCFLGTDIDHLYFYDYNVLLRKN